MTRALPFLVIASVLFSGAAPVAADWPLFRGEPTQTGVAETRLPDKLAVQWKFATGDAIESTPAVVDGVVYAASFDEHLYAIDAKTGKQLWKTKLAPMKAPVSFHAGRVYVGDIDGVFYCVNAADGKKLWEFETGAEITGGANFAAGNVLIGSHDSTLYCLNSDGKPVWKVETEGPVNGSPAVVGDRTFVAGCDSLLHVLDAKSGKELASVDMGGQAGATAAVRGESLYVGTMTNEVLGIDWKAPKIVWRYEAQRRKQPFYASAAVTEKYVVAGGRDKKLHVIDRKTGELVWDFLTDGRIDASPVVAGGRVYFGTLSDDGVFYVLDLEKGSAVQKLELDGAVIASPAVAGDRLIVCTEKGTVYSLGAK